MESSRVQTEVPKDAEMSQLTSKFERMAAELGGEYEAKEQRDADDSRRHHDWEIHEELHHAGPASRSDGQPPSQRRARCDHDGQAQQRRTRAQPERRPEERVATAAEVMALLQPRLLETNNWHQQETQKQQQHPG